MHASLGICLWLLVLGDYICDASEQTWHEYLAIASIVQKDLCLHSCSWCYWSLVCFLEHYIGEHLTLFLTLASVCFTPKKCTSLFTTQGWKQYSVPREIFGQCVLKHAINTSREWHECLVIFETCHWLLLNDINCKKCWKMSANNGLSEPYCVHVFSIGAYV